MRAVIAALRNRRALLVLSGSTVLIAINWLVYIFSVTYARILESSLGYYINPLVSVLLGVVLLGERLTPLMKAAVVAAAAGVTWLAIDLGQLPWISLVLAFSFGTYGLLRKIAPVGALIGLTVETLLLAPFCAAYLVWSMTHDRSGFVAGGPWIRTLLLLAGPVTAIPLLCFAGRGPTASPVHDGLPAVRVADAAVPAGGGGLPRAVQPRAGGRVRAASGWRWRSLHSTACAAVPLSPSWTPDSAHRVTTTFPRLRPVSTYRCASTICSNG